jgi:hypothetical protein
MSTEAGAHFMNNAKVIVLSVVAACGYGIIHDQITVRVCIEYFTVAHSPLFHTAAPTLLAVCWGVAASAGVGLALGAMLALVSQSDGQAPYPLSRLGKSILVLLGAMALSAFAAACIGYQLPEHGLVSIPAAFAEAIPEARHSRFMAVWFAHGASYLVGLGGGALLCFRIWRERGRPRVLALFPRSRGAVLRAALVVVVGVVIIWLRFGAR